MDNEQIDKDKTSGIESILSDRIPVYAAIPTAILIAVAMICKTWLAVANKPKE